MSAGDLVIFRYCAQEGNIGFITIVCERSHLAKKNPQLALYWVLCAEGHMCFTGNQMVLLP